jgi:hypothetical protein
MSPPPGPPTEQPLADVAAARDLSDLVQELQYGQRVKVIWGDARPIRYDPHRDLLALPPTAEHYRALS